MTSVISVLLADHRRIKWVAYGELAIAWVSPFASDLASAEGRKRIEMPCLEQVSHWDGDLCTLNRDAVLDLCASELKNVTPLQTMNPRENGPGFDQQGC
jgi:hypothetical protein